MAVLNGVPLQTFVTRHISAVKLATLMALCSPAHLSSS